MTITVQGKTCEYPAGTTFYEIAMQHQAEIPQEILLAKLGTKLYELHKHVPERGGEISFITGADKADILYKVFFGPVTPEVPGSILQFHSDVTLICDEAAAAKMPQ